MRAEKGSLYFCDYRGTCVFLSPRKMQGGAHEQGKGWATWRNSKYWIFPHLPLLPCRCSCDVSDTFILRQAEDIHDECKSFFPWSGRIQRATFIFPGPLRFVYFSRFKGTCTVFVFGYLEERGELERFGWRVRGMKA